MEQRAVSSHQTPALGTKIKMLSSNQRAYLDTSYVACMMCFQVFIYGWSYFKSLMAMTHPSAQDWFTFFSCQTIEIVFLINPDFWGGGGGEGFSSDQQRWMAGKVEDCGTPVSLKELLVLTRSFYSLTVLTASQSERQIYFCFYHECTIRTVRLAYEQKLGFKMIFKIKKTL